MEDFNFKWGELLQGTRTVLIIQLKPFWYKFCNNLASMGGRALFCDYGHYQDIVNKYTHTCR